MNTHFKNGCMKAEKEIQNKLSVFNGGPGSGQKGHTTAEDGGEKKKISVFGSKKTRDAGSFAEDLIKKEGKGFYSAVKAAEDKFGLTPDESSAIYDKLKELHGSK